METFVDMHIHSTYSDGEKSPEELVKLLKKKKIGTFAITDHDNIKSILNLKKLALDVEWYPGVEISTFYQNHKIHLLGYDFDYENKELCELLEWISNKRILRFYDMIKKVEHALGYQFDPSIFIKKQKEGATLNKVLLVEYLKNKLGLPSEELYEQLKPYLKSDIVYRADLKWAINCLKKANGIVCIAHPKEIEEESHIQFEYLIRELVDLKIDAIEVFHSSHNDEDIKRFHGLAQRYDLLESGGSDYHGSHIKNRELGYVTESGSKIKTLSLVKELRRRK